MVRLMQARGPFPIGAAAGLEELERDPHALLARLREHEPVSWLPALDGWLVTRRDLAMAVMRDPETFTVDDPRFSTGQVVGSSMLTLDGEEHRRHREPFARPFRLDAVVHPDADMRPARERDCCAASRTCARTRPARPSRGGSCSASHPSCASSGVRRRRRAAAQSSGRRQTAGTSWAESQTSSPSTITAPLPDSGP
jgi:hypothetical protein